MSLTAYALAYGIDDTQITGVSPESQAIARALRTTKVHMNFPASQPLSQVEVGPYTPPVNRLLASVEITVKHLENSALRAQAELVLNVFRKAASAYNVGSMPPLTASLTHNGSLLIEWLLARRRLGFNIEPNQDDSGWYFVSSKTSGGYSGSGTLSSLNMDQLMKWALRKTP